jgi:hypothetical protein
LSNNDSFIDEVTEEVRRDRLFGLFRRYGWIGVVAIVAIVAFSAWTEWSRSRAEAEAQAFGDALNAALALPTPEARTAALDALTPANGGQRAVVTLLRGAEPGAAAALDGLADAPDVPALWRDVAEFRRLVAGTDLPAADRRARFEALAAPGAPLRLLAEEQVALIDAEAGDAEAAIERMQRLLGDAEAPPALRSRVEQVIVALGGTPGGS